MKISVNPQASPDDFERKALRTTGLAFYGLAIGLAAAGLYNIFTAQRPQSTFWGVVISIVSIGIMWTLIIAKTKVGTSLNSEAILADARCTKVCVYMSLLLLASSAIYEITSFPYVDAAGTLGLAFLSFKEGRECFEKIKGGGSCGCSPK